MILINLTDRQKQIIVILAKEYESKPITMSFIADKLNISSRTVLREIGDVENWFFDSGYQFIKKVGTGVYLDETKEVKKQILKTLDEDNKPIYFSKNHRKIIILCTFFEAKEPIKAIYFTKTLKISDNALASDFLEINKWLKTFSLKLVKRQGLGAYIDGEEANIRNAYFNVIYDNYDVSALLNIIDNIDSAVNSQLFLIIDINVLKNIKIILTNVITKFDLEISDVSYLEILIHLSITVKRISLDFYRTDVMDISKIKPDDTISNITKEIITVIENLFEISFPKEEFQYIFYYLKALSKIKYSPKFSDSLFISSTEIYKIANYLVDIVEDFQNAPISYDDNFFEDLMAHLEPAVYRIILGITIKNPFMKEVKDEYLKLYNVIGVHFKKSISEITKNYVSDDEIAYITLHFIVSIEKFLLTKVLVRCVVSCPSGIGTSKLLSLKLKEQFENLDIVKTISAINIDDKKLIAEGIDLIISTVDVKTTLNFVCVTNIINFSEQDAIKKLIVSIAKDKNYSNVVTENKVEQLADYSRIMKLGEQILLLENNFKLFDNVEIKNIENLISYSANIFTNKKDDAAVLIKDLTKRLNVSLPYFEERDLFLLHCKSSAIKNISCSVIRTKEPVLISDEKITTKNVVFMAIPLDSCDCQQEVLSEISINLLNNKKLVNAIKNDDELFIKNILTEIFLIFFKQQVRTL